MSSPAAVKKDGRSPWRGKRKKAMPVEAPAGPDAWFEVYRAEPSGLTTVQGRAQGKDDAITETIRLAERNPGVTCGYRLEGK